MEDASDDVRRLEQVAKSIHELDWQKSKWGKHCEWGTACAQPVQYQCLKCKRYLCERDTEFIRIEGSWPPVTLKYCPECHSKMMERQSTRRVKHYRRNH